MLRVFDCAVDKGSEILVCEYDMRVEVPASNLLPMLTNSRRWKEGLRTLLFSDLTEDDV